MLEAVRIHREAVQDTCPPALKCTVSSIGSIGNKTDVWRLQMSLGKLYTEQAGGLGSSKRIQLIVLQLMSCKAIS